MPAGARTIRDMAGRALAGLPVSAWRRLVPKNAIGLCYHVVSDAAPAHVKHYPALTRGEFAADLDYLAERFAFTTYDRLERDRTAANPPRSNSVMLTFDDGFAECAGVIAPILSEYGFDGVFFVITDLIDNRTIFHESLASLCIDKILRSRPEEIEPVVRELNLAGRYRAGPEADSGPVRPPLEMARLDTAVAPQMKPLVRWLLGATRDDAELLGAFAARLGIDPRRYLAQNSPYLTTQQIRDLRAQGFTIGAHSCSHRLLQSLARDDAEREIVESCRVVRDITGQTTVPFAFPFFGGGLDRGWLADLRRRHEFVGLFFDTDGMREDERFVVQRVFGERLGRETTLDGILRRAWSRPAAWRRPR